MSNQKKLCLSCMSAVPGDAKACPKCGYNGTQKNPPECLPIGYRLRGRYVVGMRTDRDGDSVTYAGFDCSGNVPVEVREFLPRGGCKREPDTNALHPNPDAELHYKTALTDFCELYRNLRKLDNEPAVIRVTDFFEINQTAYAIMEKFDGVTLREFLSMTGGSLPYEKCLVLLSPVLGAIESIHSVNLIHRGISPDTIFVNRNGDVKLGGYATSSVRTKDTEVAPKLFTGYSAPEQYSATAWQNASTDVYGLAAVFYRALTGSAPQEAEQRKTCDTLEAPISLQNTVPQYASRAIMLAMLVNNRERVQTAGDFRRLLHNQLLAPNSKSKAILSAQTADKAQSEEAAVKDRPQQSRTAPRLRTGSAPASKGKSGSKKKGKQNVPWVTVIVVTLAVLLVVGVVAYAGKMLMDELNRGQEQEQQDPSQNLVEVPDYIGKKTSEIIYKNEPFVFVEEETTREGKADFEIVDQSPKAGTMVESGSSVTIYVNKSEKTEMIDVTGRTLEKAKEMLDEIGIQYTVVEDATTDKTPGTVIRQSVPEGVGINAATQTVRLTVAVAPATTPAA